MAENSKIEWTDHTFNPWIGCTKVSPGCAHCYAETLMDVRYGRVKWGKGQPRLRTSAANWKKPLSWNRLAYSFAQCEVCGWRGDRSVKKRSTDSVIHCPQCDTRGSLRGGPRPRIFCSSLADWLDEEVPVEWLADLLGLIHATPHLDWLLLTKRPQNFRSRINSAFMAVANDRHDADLLNWISAWSVEEGCEEGELDVPPSNVWIGTTVEDQERANQRIPWLLDIPARVRFLSCEPLLGPVDLTDVRLIEQKTPNHPRVTVNALTGQVSGPDEIIERVHWVICGGESGPGARPMHPDWARSLRDQCQAAQVPFLFKQWGDWVGGQRDPRKGKVILQDGTIFWTNPGHKPVHHWDNAQPFGACSARVGKASRKIERLDNTTLETNNRLLDGREWNEFPQVKEVARG